MGFLTRIADALFEHELDRISRQTDEKQKRALRLTADKLKALPDKQKLQAAIARAEQRVWDCEDMEAGFAGLSDAQKVVYTINSLDNEVANGGLCQFLCNSSRMAAPFVSDSLAAIGALEHKALFDGFIRQCGIDLNDLSSFDCDDEDAFVAQCDRFPFDDFDDALYKLKPLKLYLKRYVKAHLDAL